MCSSRDADEGLWASDAADAGDPSGLTRYTVSLREPWRTRIEALASLVSAHARLGSIIKRKAGMLLLCHHTRRRGKRALESSFRAWLPLGKRLHHTLFSQRPQLRERDGFAFHRRAAKVLTAGNGSEDLITATMLTSWGVVVQA